MLSVKVFELAVIRVGEFIVGKKVWEYKVSTLSDVFLSILQLRRFILKSPIRITFFLWRESFHSKGSKKPFVNSSRETFGCL